MAIAGKVAITPKGDWNADTTYEKLDLVFYENSSYVATKPSTGVIPTDESHWMLVVQSAGSADFDGIINGDIQVGNAKTLDGHEAEYFATAEGLKKVDGTGAVLNTSILAKALEVVEGVHVYRLGGGSYTGGDIPNGAYYYSVAKIDKRANDEITVTLSGIYSSNNKLNPPIFNMYNGTAWSGWQTCATTADLAKYLPLTGGTVGMLDVGGGTSGDKTLRVQNDVRHIINRVYANGMYRLYDMTNSKEIIESTADGTNKFYGTTTGNLPLTGGKLSGTAGTVLALENTAAAASFLQFLGKHGVSGYVGFDYADHLIFKKADSATTHAILHTGNFVEEGTFDLTLEGRVLSGYKYKKIGKFVYLSGTVAFNGEPLSFDTAVEVSGLPFKMSSIPYLYFGTDVYIASNVGTNNLANFIGSTLGTTFQIGKSGASLANGAPCVLHAMYITD